MNGRMIVVLDEYELMQGAIAGCQRRIGHLLNETEARYGDPEKPLWDVDIESCLAELATGKGINLHWTGRSRDSLGGADVGRTVQVRSTDLPHGGLIVHKDDRDDQPFVLAVGRAPSFALVGWMMGRDAKKPEYLSDKLRKPDYLVPQSALRPMSELRARPTPTPTPTPQPKEPFEEPADMPPDDYDDLVELWKKV